MDIIVAWITGIVGFAGLAVAAAAAYFTSRAAWEAKRSVDEAAKSTRTGELFTRKLGTIKFLTSWMQTYLRLPNKIQPLKDKLEPNVTSDPAERAALGKKLSKLQIELFYIWESVSTGINAGVFDLEVLDQMTGSRLLSQYKENARFVRRRRREESLRFYNQLDIVIDRLLEIRYAEHLISRETIRELQAYVDPETTRKLKALQGTWYNSDKELSLDLVKHGLEREKNLVSSYSRCHCYSILPYKEDYKEQVITLFEEVQRAGNRDNPARPWPPIEKGRIQNWLFDDAGFLDIFVLLYRRPSEHQPHARLQSHTPQVQLVGFVALDRLANTLNSSGITGKVANRFGRTYLVRIGGVLRLAPSTQERSISYRTSSLLQDLQSIRHFAGRA